MKKALLILCLFMLFSGCSKDIQKQIHCESYGNLSSEATLGSYEYANDVLYEVQNLIDSNYILNHAMNIKSYNEFGDQLFYTSGIRNEDCVQILWQDVQYENTFVAIEDSEILDVYIYDQFDYSQVDGEIYLDSEALFENYFSEEIENEWDDDESAEYKLDYYYYLLDYSALEIFSEPEWLLGNMNNSTGVLKKKDFYYGENEYYTIDSYEYNFNIVNPEGTDSYNVTLTIANNDGVFIVELESDNYWASINFNYDENNEFYSRFDEIIHDNFEE